MDDSTGIRDSLSRIIKEFRDKRKNIESVENYLLNDQQVTNTVRASLEKQMHEFMPELFQWLYECVSLRRKTTKVFIFVMQFIPDLVHLYLLCVSENLQKLKAPVEVLLLGVSKELETEKHVPVQVPSLTRPSIYHQNLSLVSPSRLTESALSHHNYDQTKTTPSQSPSFLDKEITVTNRLPFLTHVMRSCINHVSQFNSQSQTGFCLICTKITLSGMTDRCIAQVANAAITHQTCLTEETLISLRNSKRINLSDDFLSCLLHGIRMCLFQSCHFPAKQALLAARIRAEYNIFPLSLQISQTLERLVNEIHPLRLPLDTEIHKTYSNKDANNWASKPSTIVRTFIGQVLYHQTNQPSSQDNPHDVLDEQLSIDADELLVSQSFEDTLTSSSSPHHHKPATDSPDDGDGGITFDIKERNYSSEEEGGSLETTPTKRDDDDKLSPSGITIVLQRSTPEQTVENEHTTNVSSTARVRTISASSMKTTEV